jgi:hypothetical protein
MTEAVLEPEADIVLEATRAQIEMMEDPAQICVWALGRAYGKSTCASLLLTKVAVENDGCTVWYVCPRYATALRIMRIMGKCPEFMELVAAKPMQFPPRYELKNGSEIWFVSADKCPDDLRGPRCRLIFMDEAAAGTEYMFWNVLFPMVADSGGKLIAASTFNGRNWFYVLAVKGTPATENAKKLAKGEDANHKTWIYKSNEGMRFSGSPAALLRYEITKKLVPPLVFQQEYDCEPLAVHNMVFTYLEQCITKEIPPNTPQEGEEYVVAQDIGRVVDQSGVVVMNLKTGMVVHAETYPLGMLHREQAQRTAELGVFWNNAIIALDTTGGASGGRSESNIKYYEEFITDFEAITFTTDTKRSMVNHLGLEIENQRVWIPECMTELVSQMRLFQYKVAERAVQPTFFGKPDDLVSGLLMCAWIRKREYPYEHEAEDKKKKQNDNYGGML